MRNITFPAIAILMLGLFTGCQLKCKDCTPVELKKVFWFYYGSMNNYGSIIAKSDKGETDSVYFRMVRMNPALSYNCSSLTTPETDPSYCSFQYYTVFYSVNTKKKICELSYSRTDEDSSQFSLNFLEYTFSQKDTVLICDRDKSKWPIKYDTTINNQQYYNVVQFTDTSARINGLYHVTFSVSQGLISYQTTKDTVVSTWQFETVQSNK
jgi:hypothetical protein